MYVGQSKNILGIMNNYLNNSNFNNKKKIINHLLMHY